MKTVLVIIVYILFLVMICVQKSIIKDLENLVEMYHKDYMDLSDDFHKVVNDYIRDLEEWNKQLEKDIEDKSTKYFEVKNEESDS